MMKKKQFLCALFALLLALGFALPAFAADKVFAVDDMQKISDGSLAEFNGGALAISKKYQMDVAFFLTANDYAPGQTLTEYTRERYLNEQKLGPDGFALAHDADGKVYTLVCFGKAEQLLTNEDLNSFWAAYDGEDTYAGGARAYLQAAGKYLAQAIPVSASGSAPDAPQALRDPETVSLLTDEAGLLSDAEAANLREKLGTLSANWKNDILIVTVDSLGGNTPTEFADDWFDYNGYGQAASGGITDGGGVLLLVSMEERDWWISTKGYAIQVFTDAGIEFLGDRLIADGLSSGDYASAFNGFADWCDKYYIQAETGKPYDTGNMPQAKKTSADYITVAAVCFGAGLLIAFFVTRGMKKQLKTVRKKQAAADYLRPGSLQVLYANEQFLHRNVTKVYNPPSESSSGGSSSHSSSSGSSHGGGGGKF